MKFQSKYRFNGIVINSLLVLQQTKSQIHLIFTAHTKKTLLVYSLLYFAHSFMALLGIETKSPTL